MEIFHSRLNLLFSLLIASFLVWSSGVKAQLTRYEIKDVGFRNTVFFVSNAPWETIVGTSNFITGWMELNPLNLKEGIKGQIEVDVRTFETAAPARNAKVRELFLGASKQPIAVFIPGRLLQFSAPTLKPGTSVNVKVEGTLSANGVESRLVLPLRLSYWKDESTTKKDGTVAKKKGLAGNLVQVRGEFLLSLADFKLGIPALYQGVVDPTPQFSVHFFGTDRLPASPTP